MGSPSPQEIIFYMTSELRIRIQLRSEKIIPDPDSSGSEINLKCNYSVKLTKFDNFSRNMLNL
jgi:hypothetical protein